MPARMRWLFLVWLACLAGLALPASAAAPSPVQIEPGRSHEMVEGSARYLLTEPGTEISFEEALRRYNAGEFGADLAARDTSELHDWRVWIALPFESQAAPDTAPMRKVIGIGGIFVRLPRVYVSCGADTPREILADQTRDGGPLSARYFTYIRSQSFEIDPGASCLAMINMASSDRPNIGIFREGELGTRQVVAVLLKGSVTASLLIIGLLISVVAFLTSRPLGVLIGMTFSLWMLQSEASVFTTRFGAGPLAAHETWENITLLAIFATLLVFLSGFKELFRLRNWTARTAIAGLLVLPLVYFARSSNAASDIIWALHLGLFLFALTVTLRFPTAWPLRLVAGVVLLVCAIAAVLIEPTNLGREMTDLTIEWFRDAIRLLAGIGMLVLLVVDVFLTRRERARMIAERIETLETQAETDRRLLETEREYTRAREAAARTKAQLAAASHDIRQPIVGLRAAIFSKTEPLSPELQTRLGDAIDYLERLTREYTQRQGIGLEDEEDPQDAPYSVALVTDAVSNMFKGEAKEAGVKLNVSTCDFTTQVPALALIRATSNLVANALRHAEPKSVEITAQDKGDTCKIKVKDDGRGMDSLTLDVAQTAGKKSETSDGDGLGLAIVHDLAARHGFTFTLSSAPGEGTEATITIHR
jgi:signal transduction histidine kinase